MTSPTPTDTSSVDTPAPTGTSAASAETPETAALAECLTIAHGAVFGYGVVAAYADGSRREAIAAAAAAHRAYREALRQALIDAGRTPPIAAAGYTLPFPVSDPVSAIQLALRIEEDTTIGWRALLERAETGHIKSVGADALTETAIRAARWRTVLVVNPSTVPFPGQST